MIYYIATSYSANKYEARTVRRVIRVLQLRDPDNSYIAPSICFSYFAGDVERVVLKENYLDLLSVSDALLYIDKNHPDVREQIEFANRLHMEALHYSEVKRL